MSTTAIEFNPLMIKIKSDRLCLEFFTRDHITQQYVQWLNDPMVVRYSEQRHYRHTHESCECYLKSFSETTHLFLAISLLNTGEHIGNITAHIDIYNNIADMGILIGEKKYWGKGYGLEAWKRLCEYLFSMGIRKITAGTMTSNGGMFKIMQRAGMQIEGYRYKHFLCENIATDIVYTALFNPKIEH